MERNIDCCESDVLVAVAGAMEDLPFVGLLLEFVLVPIGGAPTMTDEDDVGELLPDDDDEDPLPTTTTLLPPPVVDITPP